MIGLVVGVPGVGKTTVLNTAKKYLNRNFEIVNFGDILFEYLKKHYDLKNKDEIRKKIPYDIYYKSQIEVCKILYDKYKNKDILIDTHFLIKTKFGFLPGLSKEMAKYLKPNFIVVIIAEPHYILHRRLKDKTRQRDIELVHLIDLHQNLTLNYSLTLAYDLHIPIIVIENQEGHVEKAGKELAEALNSI